MKRSMIAVVGVLAVVILMGAVESSMADLTLSDGYRTDSTIQGAVRYKDLGNTGTGGDIYLGIPDLGIGGNRVEQTFYGTGGNWTSTNYIEFIYDKTTDELVTNVTTSNVTMPELVYSNFSTKMPNPSYLLNYLQIGMRASSTGTVTLQNFDLDGNSLASVASLDGTYKTWYLTGYDFSNGFDLKADLVLTGILGSNESSKVDIGFGQAPEPATLALLALGGVGLLARRRRGK